MNAWVFAKELPSLARHAPDEHVRRAASVLHAHHSVPVDSIFLGPDLELLAEGAANDMIHTSSWTRAYRELIDEALAAARADG